jgi:two-component system response regulator AlgR
MQQTLKILIADDEPPARNRMRDLLADIEHVTVVAEAKNGKEAIELAQSTTPDVML